MRRNCARLPLFRWIVGSIRQSPIQRTAQNATAPCSACYRPLARRLLRARPNVAVDTPQQPPPDDDAICRANNTEPGSPAYIVCRKERDAARARSEARADRSQRNLGEYMLNNPVAAVILRRSSMNEDSFNAACALPQEVGITSQREIEKAVRDAVASGKLKATKSCRPRWCSPSAASA